MFILHVSKIDLFYLSINCWHLEKFDLISPEQISFSDHLPLQAWIECFKNTRWLCNFIAVPIYNLQHENISKLAFIYKPYQGTTFFSNGPIWTPFKKMGQPWPLFCLFSVFSNKENIFYNKSMWKMSCPSSVRCQDSRKLKWRILINEE